MLYRTRTGSEISTLKHTGTILGGNTTVWSIFISVVSVSLVRYGLRGRGLGWINLDDEYCTKFCENAKKKLDQIQKIANPTPDKSENKGQEDRERKRPASNAKLNGKANYGKQCIGKGCCPIDQGATHCLNKSCHKLSDSDLWMPVGMGKDHTTISEYAAAYHPNALHLGIQRWAIR